MRDSETRDESKGDVAELEGPLDKQNFEQVEFSSEKEGGIARDYSGVAISKTDPKEIRLVRKQDFIILPMLWILYFWNFMDRNALTNAALDGISDDLGLKGTEYNTCISILFVGYLLGQIPSNMALTRLRISWFIGAFVMIWSVVSALTAIVTDYKGLLLIRFFLGFVEAPFYPGALYILSIFYTKKELSLRIALFYTGNIAASAFAGLIAAAVFATLDGAHGLKGWQWLFIVTGVVSFGSGILASILLPDKPTSTWWMTEEEREIAVRRMKEDTTEDHGTTGIWQGLKEACLDPRTWLFSFMMNMHISAEGFRNFFPSVVSTLHFSRTITLVLTCPPYIISCFGSALLSYSSGRRNERTWHVTIATIFVTVGFIIAAATTNIAARYVGMVIFVSFSAGINDICLSWAASTLSQTPEKKAAALAIVNMLSNLSSTYTPYLWPSADAPRYIKGMASSAVFSVLVAATAWILLVMLKRDNVRIRQTMPESVVLYAY
ncbi:major facilitator superfamily domain-containing protein [Dipodascopsis uninucleata]